MSEIEKIDQKNNFIKSFESLRQDLFFPEEWDQSQIEKATELIRPQRTKNAMFSSIPMSCQSSKCVYASTCPLYAENLAPHGKPCPIEMSMVSQFTSEYMHQLDVSPDNLVEVSMVRDLVDQEVQYLRKTKLLAKEHFIQENIVGIDPNSGEPIMKKELHLAVELEDRLHKRRKDLRNQLLATREARAKVGQVQLDTAQAISEIIEKVKNVETERNKILRQKLGTYEIDDYIVDSESSKEKENG